MTNIMQDDLVTCHVSHARPDTIDEFRAGALVLSELAVTLYEREHSQSCRQIMRANVYKYRASISTVVSTPIRSKFAVSH